MTYTRSPVYVRLLVVALVCGLLPIEGHPSVTLSLD